MAGPDSKAKPTPAAAPATGKKPEEAKGIPAPKGSDIVKPVPVQFFAVRLFARHIAASGGSFSFVGSELTVSPASKIELTYGVSEAAVFVKMFLADKDFAVVKTTTGKGRSRKEVETLAKINGQVTLKVENSGKYGFVHRTVETVREGKRTKTKVVETAPAASLTLDVTNGESPIGKAGDGVYVLRALAAASLDPAKFPKDPPGPDTKITVEVGKFKDEKKKNDISEKQLGAEHVGKDSPVEWPVTSKNLVDPELPHRRWPSDDELSGLQEKFRSNVEAWFNALKAVKLDGSTLVSTIPINTAYRTPQTAYLFCWARRVVDGSVKPQDVPSYKNEDGLPDPEFPEIDWRLAQPYAARHFGRNPTAPYNPPGTTSNHLRRLAVDCNLPVNIAKKFDCTIKLPASFYKITLKKGADGKMVPEAALTNNDPKKTEEAFTLEPNDGANGWVELEAREYAVRRTSGKDSSDKQTYTAGTFKAGQAPADATFTIDSSGVTLTEAEKKKIKEEVEKEVKAKHEAALAKEVELAANKTITKREAERKRAKQPPLTEDEKKKIRDDVEKPLRAKHEKAMKQEIEQQVNARIRTEEAAKKKAERDKQFATKAPKAEQAAKDAVEAQRKREGNYWKQLHRIGEQFFGVIHFKPPLRDLPHWSHSGG
jgi:hypothetical protein